MSKIAQLIATCGPTGWMRPAPGSWGSLLSLGLSGAIIWIGGLMGLGLFILAIAILGQIATAEYLRASGRSDPSEVVIDEVLGQAIACLPLIYWGLSIWGILIVFGLFRLFDIVKIGPVGWADRQPGAWGVMLDDAIAGVMAAIMGGGLLWLIH